jgi:lysophospholipase L1-like esterase
LQRDRHFNGNQQGNNCSHNCNYIDITTGSRQAKNNPASFVDDKLHPSGAEYKRWALEVARVIKDRL